jgi:two-component system CheB/CheR fusion protein
MHSSSSRKHEVKLIPPVDGGAIFVTADSQKLQQVFLNLLENAVQHTPEGSPIHIVIHKPESGSCRVEVVDSGSGIEEAMMPRIFEPFFSTRRGGVGLGMSIVKHIVEAHDGAVGVENNLPPPGCTVKITFPCAENQP